jgi:hypothetical protein
LLLGDHVEIEAMRELYNKNVEIYDRKSIEHPKLLAFELDTSDSKDPPEKNLSNSKDLNKLVKTVRLSFHGNNHYNSVINPSDPPPLGDGKESIINIRAIRIQYQKLQQEKAKKAIINKSNTATNNPNNNNENSNINHVNNNNDHVNTEPSVVSNSSSPATEVTNDFDSITTRKPRTVDEANANKITSTSINNDLTFNVEHLKSIWKTYDKLGTNSISDNKIESLLTTIINHMYETKLSNNNNAVHMGKLNKSLIDLKSNIPALARQFLINLSNKSQSQPNQTPNSSLQNKSKNQTLPRNFQLNQTNTGNVVNPNIRLSGSDTTNNNRTINLTQFCEWFFPSILTAINTQLAK